MGKWLEAARPVRAAMDVAGAALDDAAALEAMAVFKPWTAGTAYAADDRIRYGDSLYRCVQAHTAQADWTPDATPALWARVSVEEWPEWVQPTGAQDAYSIGDKVTYEGVRYVSLIDGNVWPPAAHPQGWEAQA